MSIISKIRQTPHTLRTRVQAIGDAASSLHAVRLLHMAYAAPSLVRVDKKPVPAGKNEIRLFVAARNERLRFPYFLKYYRELGVDRFFVIDNGSTDGTVPLLTAEPDVHVFRTDAAFRFKG